MTLRRLCRRFDSNDGLYPYRFYSHSAQLFAERKDY
ncbi:Hypothetical Protein XCAW_04487 [Xanthomonas citri subsp. citri Aw12879]|nr:Hypothetical Protein XCAW_04487 [Xanthomonas citri subsp. citri Aw12879]